MGSTGDVTVLHAFALQMNLLTRRRNIRVLLMKWTRPSQNCLDSNPLYTLLLLLLFPLFLFLRRTDHHHEKQHQLSLCHHPKTRTKRTALTDNNRAIWWWPTLLARLSSYDVFSNVLNNIISYSLECTIFSPYSY